ncbi:MAG TPA: hypothetical protein VIV40_07490 [Kofleriaceae bacterium]
MRRAQRCPESLRALERTLQSNFVMRTTIGDLVSELVDQYEAIYDDHELAAVATSVTLDDILHDHEERKRRPDSRKRSKR